MSSTFRHLYEQDFIRLATGDTLRPGGLALTERLLDNCDLAENARILDLGCGCGASLDWLYSQGRFHTVGLDISMKLLREAVKRCPSVACAPVQHLPFGDAAFHAAILECSLSVMILNDTGNNAMGTIPLSDILLEIWRVLEPGGWMLISDLYAKQIEGIPALRTLPGSSCLRGILNLPELLDKLQEAGFDVMTWEDHSSVLKQFGSRLCQVYGSSQVFWQKAESNQFNAFELMAAIGRAKPGYFILLARKKT